MRSFLKSVRACYFLVKIISSNLNVRPQNIFYNNLIGKLNLQRTWESMVGCVLKLAPLLETPAEGRKFYLGIQRIRFEYRFGNRGNCHNHCDYYSCNG